MAIRSRSEIDSKATTDIERDYERKLFKKVVYKSKLLTNEQFAKFGEDKDLRGMYCADLLDNDKQALFTEKLGTPALEKLNNTRMLHKLRSREMIEDRSVGLAVEKLNMDSRYENVINQYDDFGNIDQDAKTKTLERIQEQKAQDEEKAVEEMGYDPETFGIRTHSIGDRKSQTLFFDNQNDIFGLGTAYEFDYKEKRMGSAQQAILYEQSLMFDMKDRADKISEKPMSGKELLENGIKTVRFDDPAKNKQWTQQGEEVIHDVMYAKFSQEGPAKDALLKTESLTLAFAGKPSPLTIGVTIEDVKVAQERAVKFKKPLEIPVSRAEVSNSLGKSVQNVRTQIREEERAKELERQRALEQEMAEPEIQNEPGYEDLPFDGLDFGDDPVVEVEADVDKANMAIGAIEQRPELDSIDAPLFGDEASHTQVSVNNKYENKKPEAENNDFGLPEIDNDMDRALNAANAAIRDDYEVENSSIHQFSSFIPEAVHYERPAPTPSPTTRNVEPTPVPVAQAHTEPEFEAWDNSALLSDLSEVLGPIFQEEQSYANNYSVNNANRAIQQDSPR